MEEIEVGEEEVSDSVGFVCNEMSAIVSTFFHHTSSFFMLVFVFVFYSTFLPKQVPKFIIYCVILVCNLKKQTIKTVTLCCKLLSIFYLANF
jgi:hypothetical protein